MDLTDAHGHGGAYAGPNTRREYTVDEETEAPVDALDSSEDAANEEQALGDAATSHRYNGGEAD